MEDFKEAVARLKAATEADAAAKQGTPGMKLVAVENYRSGLALLVRWKFVYLWIDPETPTAHIPCLSSARSPQWVACSRTPRLRTLRRWARPCAWWRRRNAPRSQGWRVCISPVKSLNGESLSTVLQR
jgi:hypothetical protein